MYKKISVIHYFTQVVIIDELSITKADMRKMEADKTSELEETLTWLECNTAMTLAALSTTSLLDKDANSEGLSQIALNKMVMRTGFVAVREALKHLKI